MKIVSFLHIRAQFRRQHRQSLFYNRFLCKELLLRAGERQRHALVLRLKERDRERVGLAELERIAELRRRRELADVHEACDALLDRGERTVLVVLDDNALDL
ncbi:MAG TPA: hypothetical protein VLB84_10795, partial [Bacteroidia bacterium]|nr:hypothetical protein [Bacteroidia bacterium]